MAFNNVMGQNTGAGIAVQETTQMMGQNTGAGITVQETTQMMGQNTGAGQVNGIVVQEITPSNYILNVLNNLGKVKSWIKPADMEVGKQYRILGTSQMISKFDPSKMKTILELEIGYLSLPARFDNMDQQTFEWMCLKPNLAVVNNGAVGKTFKIEFTTISAMDYYNSIQKIVT